MTGHDDLAMPFSIPEPASAAGRSESHVRLHVLRKRSAVQEKEYNLHAASDDTIRPTRAFRIPFDTPAHAREPSPPMKDRTARMTVLALQRPAGKPSNMLTAVRHRRRDALGPWAKEPSKKWTSETLGDGLRLHSLDAPLEHCQELVQDIRDKGMLTLGREQVAYALEPAPRIHRLFREMTGRTDAPMGSPFSRHSAEVTEYWSLADEPRRLWLELLDASDNQIPVPLSRLGVPLDRLTDRVGNVMFIRAEDEVACDLWQGLDGSLRLLLDAAKLVPGAYRATVWASHAGDEVLRQEVPVARRINAIPITSDVDRIGFEVFRTADRQCIDRMEADLFKHIGGQIRINSPLTIQLGNRKGRAFHEVSLPGLSTGLDVNVDESTSDLEKGIRQQSLERRLRSREVDARKARGFARFRPDEIDGAVRYLVGILQQDSDRKTPIYLADPHFETHIKGNKGNRLERKRIYLDIFAATAGTPLHVLCAKELPGKGMPPPWWHTCPRQLTDHIQVRSFRSERVPDQNVHSQDGRRNGFHDRFLITPKREIMVSHSIKRMARLRRCLRHTSSRRVPRRGGTSLGHGP